MTTEKAVKLLHRIADEQFDGIHGDERRKALEMAVRALEGDGDMISRQAVMVVFENSGLDDDSKDTVVRVLEQLPSAQPEPSQVARDICTILENEQDMRVILKNAQPQRTPCDLCKYNPPSSFDGKPCTICPAVGRGESE